MASASTLNTRTRADAANGYLEAAYQNMGILPDVQPAIARLAAVAKQCAKNKYPEKLEEIARFLDLVDELRSAVLYPIISTSLTATIDIDSKLNEGIKRLSGTILAAAPEPAPKPTFPLLKKSDTSFNTLPDVISALQKALDDFLDEGSIDFEESKGKDGVIIKVLQKSKPASFGAAPFGSEGPEDDKDDSLTPLVNEILKECPRFRILLLGKSGVGKSSLVNRIFGVPFADVQDYKPGYADIEEGFTSDTNPRFILHDSMGFESGSTKTFDVVKNFIASRAEKENVADQIHAVWLCTAVPRSGSRVFERGDEAILSMKSKVPIIVVFTKLDELHMYFEAKLNDEYAGPGEPDFDWMGPEVKAKVDEEFERACVEPLKSVCRDVGLPTIPPYARVSVEDGFEDTISDLIKLTTQKTAGVIHLLWAIAQRGDSDTSIDATITIGRKKYWAHLAIGTLFKTQLLQRVMTTLHRDIIKVWNLRDDHDLLDSIEFRAQMSKLVEDLADIELAAAASAMTLNASGALLVATTGISRVVPGSAAVIAPVAAVVVFAAWVYQVYQQTPSVVRCLMAYIVDLSCIMQKLFWKMRARGGDVSLPSETLGEALSDFEGQDKASVHSDIRAFIEEHGSFTFVHKDLVLEEIVRLIQKYRMQPPARPPRR